MFHDIMCRIYNFGLTVLLRIRDFILNKQMIRKE